MTEKFPLWREMTPEATEDYIDEAAEAIDPLFKRLVMRARWITKEEAEKKWPLTTPDGEWDINH